MTILVQVKIVDHLFFNPFAPLQFHVPYGVSDIITAGDTKREKLAVSVNALTYLLDQEREVFATQGAPLF